MLYDLGESTEQTDLPEANFCSWAIGASPEDPAPGASIRRVNPAQCVAGYWGVLVASPLQALDG